MLVRTGLDLHFALVRSLFGDAAAPHTYDRAAQARALPPSRPWLSTEL
jgi:hypothetical protein